MAAVRGVPTRTDGALSVVLDVVLDGSIASTLRFLRAWVSSAAGELLFLVASSRQCPGIWPSEAPSRFSLLFDDSHEMGTDRKHAKVDD